MKDKVNTESIEELESNVNENSLYESLQSQVQPEAIDKGSNEDKNMETNQEYRHSSFFSTIRWICIIVTFLGSIIFMSIERNDIALYFFSAAIVTVIPLTATVGHFRNQEKANDLLQEIAASLKNK